MVELNLKFKKELNVGKKENFSLKIGDGFPVEKALKKFKRLADAYGIVKNYRAREAYQKPSVKEKEKLENAEKRRRKTESKNRSYGRKI